MGLRIIVTNADILREAIQAVPVGGSTMVIVSWTPQYFAVQSMLSERLGKGQNPTTLLKLKPESFSSYESTDNCFNAAVEAAGLESVFLVAENSEPIEFSQSLQHNNGLNDLGFLLVRFSRRIDFMEDHISLKIYGMLPEKKLKSVDVANDPSLYAPVPVAIFCAADFVDLMDNVKTLGTSVILEMSQDSVNFSTSGTKFIMNKENGLRKVRKDVVEYRPPIRYTLHLQNLGIQTCAKLSDTVVLLNRAQGVILLWFALSRTRTLLRGALVYYYY